MFRIKLATGEETVLRTVEELSVAVHNGIVGPDALIHHNKTGKWLPITVHPEYKAARERRPPAPPPDEMGTAPVVVIRRRSSMPVAAALPPHEEPTPILHMLSRSGKEMLSRGSSWTGRNGPGLVVVTLAGLLGAGLFIFLVRAHTPVEEQAIIVPPRRPAVVRDTARAATPDSVAAVVDSAPAPSPLPAVDELGAGYRAAREAVRTSLEDNAQRLSLSRLLSPSRLARPDSVRSTRRALGALRTTFEEFRRLTVRVDRTFGDSAQALARAGWTAAQASAWRVRPTLAEPPDLARRADSLLTALEGIYGVLLEQEGQYDNNERTISFNDSDAAARYEGIRDRFITLAIPPPAADLLAAPELSFLLKAIAGGRVPEVIVRAPALPAAN